MMALSGSTTSHAFCFSSFSNARAPARAAERQHEALWRGVARDGFENIARCGQANAGRNILRALRRVVIV